MIKIAFIVIATNKYTQFLLPLLSSLDEYLQVSADVTYCLFSDVARAPSCDRKVMHVYTQHRPWPAMTLFRYHLFCQNTSLLKEFDYLYYLDVDMLLVDKVGSEIIGDRVATIHPGFRGGRGTPESNPASTAYVSPETPMTYFAGGFNGGQATTFLEMSATIAHNIDADSRKGITAVWHDESHLNRFLIDNPPSVILDPTYCFPEPPSGYVSGHGAKIVSLWKNNKALHI